MQLERLRVNWSSSYSERCNLNGEDEQDRQKLWYCGSAVGVVDRAMSLLGGQHDILLGGTTGG